MTFLDVQQLEVHFPVKRGFLFERDVAFVQAVDGVDLQVGKRETYGLVGESGCGKTTFGRALLRLVEPTAGTVRLDGVDLVSLSGRAMRAMRRRAQMIFQDPMASLNPRQSIGTTLAEPLIAHAVNGGKAGHAKMVRELLDAVGLPSSAVHRYPHEFSGGQRQRIGIARSIALKPDLVIADEPFSALDVSTQAQIINLLGDLQEQFELTYVVIAHDLAVVKHISDRVGVMYLGSIVEEAPSDALYREAMHPYTMALISAIPVLDPVVEDSRERIVLRGDLPSPANPPSGCRFHTRCRFRQPERCDTERPTLRLVGPGHKVACHFAEEIQSGSLA